MGVDGTRCLIDFAGLGRPASGLPQSLEGFRGTADLPNGGTESWPWRRT